MWCSNGPKYVSYGLQDWAKKREIRIDFMQPGKPQQNACMERYNRTVCHGCMSQHLFEDIECAKWLWSYNNERPNMGISGITPRQELRWAA